MNPVVHNGSVDRIQPSSQESENTFNFRLPTLKQIKESACDFGSAVASKPLSFLARTTGAIVVGAIGAAATSAAFSSWPFIAAIGFGVMAAGAMAGDGGGALIALGGTIAAGPITTGLGTVALMAKCYDGFLESKKPEN